VKVDTLEQLGAAFGEWRRGKKHPREKVPEELLKRARRSAEVHGEERVVRIAKVARRRLTGTWCAGGSGGKAAPAPAYSRLELGAAPATRPFAELEMPNGTKLRLYSQSREALDLLSAVCGSGGAR
jgi:hypothetical protein